MSDPRPSIAELKAQHEAMTVGRWESEVESDQQANIFSREHWIALLPNRSVTANEANHVLDAAGICALHAAAPALLEIAAAAREMIEARLELDHEKYWPRHRLAEARLNAALDKVRQ